MPYPRTLARAVCTIAAVTSLSIAAAGLPTATAEPDFAPQPPDPSYVLQQVWNLIGGGSGMVRDVLAPGMLDYFVKAGILTNLGHFTDAFADLTKPETFTAPDSQQRLVVAAQRVWDAVTHLPPFSAGFPPHPDYLPDWNSNGHFGIDDTAGQVIIAPDSDTMVDDNYDDPRFQEAAFRLPCLNPDGSVFYETTAGSCAPGDSGADFKVGQVKKFKIINSRGIPLSAKIWFPPGAENSDAKFPVAVGLPGAAEKQLDIGMYAESAVRNGFIAITVAQAGQPGSAGSLLDMYVPLLSVPDCFAPTSCRDAQDAVRWVFGEPVNLVVDLADELANLAVAPPRLIRYDPAYAPAGKNMVNPWLDRMDLEHVSLFGQSIGAVGVSSYLDWQVKGHGIDGKPLPRVASASVMSGFQALNTDVPLQMQTADIDIPGLSGYGITNFPQPFFNATDGPFGTMDRYRNILASGTTAPVQWISYESGSHGDSINWVGVPRSLGGPALSVDYSMAWFNCYGRADRDDAACDSLSKPRVGLSRAFASEYAPAGAAGPNLCLRIPDRASIGQVIRPEWFIDALNGRPRYDCRPQA
ncbi:hypothetical protein F3087_36915 [Nocardia colli]|uniref:Alpha/beta hydrolase n=1 Tax=Nocardia colli TaxID=2545717 RepID=A0A5N0E4G4_9NOCA|nr:hypothetical protein [Nocardia colli]KAA8883846.1 hypothetical protein F3087_36915 [Nocardia colli]